MTVESDQDIVVFLIGARINKWWLLPVSLPILARMGAMLKELRADESSGLLGVQPLGMGGTVQYWRSLEHLERYANDRAKQHRPAWLLFMKKLFKSSAAGIWHETFFVRAGEYESVYTNMPRFGMGRFKELVVARGRRESFAKRLARGSAAMHGLEPPQGSGDVAGA